MTAPRLFVTGTSGYLGHEVAKQLRERGLLFRPLGRAQGIDLLDPFGIEEAWEDILARPGGSAILIHLAAMSRWGACEEAPESAWRANGEAPGALATVLERHGGRLVYISTDLVFDGENAPYAPGDEPRASSVYGKSKRGGELMALAGEHALVLRIPLLYGPSFDGTRGASDQVLNALRSGKRLRLFGDEWRTPLLVTEAAGRIIELARDPDAVGIRHLPGPERLSRYELGCRVAEEAGLDTGSIERGSQREMPGPRRPADCSLSE